MGPLFLKLTIPGLVAVSVACSSGRRPSSADSSSRGGSGSAPADDSLSGDYVVIFQGDGLDEAENGFLALSVDDANHVAVRSASTLVAEVDIGDGDTIQFSASLEETAGATAFEGTFRSENGNSYAWGTWSSSSGHQGLFGGYGVDNQYPYLESLESACEKVVACGLMSSVSMCTDLTRCGAGFFGAESAACADAIARNLTVSLEEFGSLSPPSNCTMPGSDPADGMPATCHANADLCVDYSVD